MTPEQKAEQRKRRRAARSLKRIPKGDKPKLNKLQLFYFVRGRYHASLNPEINPKLNVAITAILSHNDISLGETHEFMTNCKSIKDLEEELGSSTRVYNAIYAEALSWGGSRAAAALDAPGEPLDEDSDDEEGDTLFDPEE